MNALNLHKKYVVFFQSINGHKLLFTNCTKNRKKYKKIASNDRLRIPFNGFGSVLRTYLIKLKRLQNQSTRITVLKNSYQRSENELTNGAFVKCRVQIFLSV